MTDHGEHHPKPLHVRKNGSELLTDPLLNKGTAFTDAERTAFSLHGLLPPHLGTLQEQVTRRLDAIRELDSPLQKYLLLRSLQDANETLYYALLVQHLEEMLPLVYTPTVGLGCQRFSHYWHYPRGLFISYPHRDRIDAMLAHPAFDDVEVIVVSDGERILGLGDQGAGGMGIPIGKLSLYTACAGIAPATTLPVLLDCGTDNRERLDDPLYIGWRHQRVRGPEYDAFVERFVDAVKRRWPHVLLQWEDFARPNALRLLRRYRDELCTFNDDVQGTAAVAAGTLLAAARATGSSLTEQTIVIFGAGSAGCGIGRLLLRMLQAEGLSEQEARQRFYAIDRQGLLLEDDPGLLEFQRPFARSRDAVAGWKGLHGDRIELIDVVRNAHPTVLLGVSGQPGVFDETVIRSMAEHVEQPIVLPLSNPVSRAEAAPQDVLDWSEGRALIGTGSPFDPVEVEGRHYTVDQTNNAYVFPGVGLGVLAVKAQRVNDAMFATAARALGHATEVDPAGPARLLPPIGRLREVARTVAIAVARQARADGLCEPFDDDALEAMIDARMWWPEYRPYLRTED